MHISPEENKAIIGTSMGDGFYAGRSQLYGMPFALIVAPKAEGRTSGIWVPGGIDVPGAKSYFDGMNNTIAMAEAGSEIAKWAVGLRIGGNDDWFLPSQDEVEIVYRNLKPTAEENYCYARSGINLSAIPLTRPYTPELPLQTSAEAFQAGGAEAFDDAAYWTSTRHASDSGYAWYQYFDDGTQSLNYTLTKLRAFVVRRLPL